MADIVDFGSMGFATEATWQERPRSAGERSYLSFLVGGEEYGVELARTREIIRARPPTELPRAPSFVSGIISVRGVVMPVIDLRLRLAMPAPPLGPLARFMVVARGEERFALVVDEVRQVLPLGEGEIEPAPAMIVRSSATGGAQAELVAGIGRSRAAEGRLIILLDLDAVLRFDVRSRPSPLTLRSTP